MPQRTDKLSNTAYPLAANACHAALRAAKEALLGRRLFKCLMPRFKVSAVAQVSDRLPPEPPRQLATQEQVSARSTVAKDQLSTSPTRNPQRNLRLHHSKSPVRHRDTTLSHGRTQRQNHAMAKVHPQIAQDWESLLAMGQMGQTLSDTEALSMKRIMFVAGWSERPWNRGTGLEECEIWDSEKEVLLRQKYWEEGSD
ncbi:hypothetical protein AC579_4004 [Pseudocercospora musae]|uniref:Uncharacterized protein n=1 Tax=Pseudocercospora musae TaxID=113226 RepID=A0A139II56_9PEZI|nr:hypothetical protein AC579_4004 [Pseudocercospora musae]